MRSFLLIVLGISHAVRIEKLLVPELVQSGSPVVLDCQYVDAGDQVLIQWILNSSERSVYEWSPGTEPAVLGILDGQIDLTYRISSVYNEERRAIRITAADPELTGDYTCRVEAEHQEICLTKSMLVFSPEKDFSLEFHHRKHSVEVICGARSVYPQPELIIERNGLMCPRQLQRVWRSGGVLYDAETTATLLRPSSDLRSAAAESVTCRLQLPQAGYTAMKKELLCFEEICESKTTSLTLQKSSVCFLLAIIMAVIT